MSPIGGPGGIGGPEGPGGPDGAGGVDGADEVADVDATDATDAASQVSPSQLDALAADIAAGKLTAKEAIDRMVDQAGGDLGSTERAELRELLTDLVANDPYLAGLVGRV
jgi:hypothetical protein